jgi:hypothetical protein
VHRQDRGRVNVVGGGLLAELRVTGVEVRLLQSHASLGWVRLPATVWWMIVGA